MNFLCSKETLSSEQRACCATSSIDFYWVLYRCPDLLRHQFSDKRIFICCQKSL